MEAKEILNKYREQIVTIQKPVKRAVEAVEETRFDRTSSEPLRDDNISFINACVALDLDQKDMSERSKNKLKYIIDEFKRLGSEKPEDEIVKTLSKIGHPPFGQDVVSHLSNYLRLRASSDEIGSKK